MLRLFRGLAYGCVAASGAAVSLLQPACVAPPPHPSTHCRVLYCARNESDHGPVENSEEGMEADAPVLEAELDIEALCSDEDQEQ